MWILQAQESYAQLCDLTCILVLKTNCIGRGEGGHCFPAFVSNACCREPVKNRRSQRTEVWAKWKHGFTNWFKRILSHYRYDSFQSLWWCRHIKYSWDSYGVWGIAHKMYYNGFIFQHHAFFFFFCWGGKMISFGIKRIPITYYCQLLQDLGTSLVNVVGFFI